MIHVNKQLVHKSREENVFVYNMRRKLPKKINRILFEDVILATTGEKNRERLKREFIEKNLDFVFGSDAKDSVNKHIFLSHYLSTKKKLEEMFDQYVFESIKEKEKEFLCTYYKLLTGDSYVFCEAPYRIQQKKLTSIMDNLGEEERDFLHQCYCLDPKKNSYILSETVSEIDEERIIRIIQSQNLCINDHDRAHLSDLLDCFKYPEREYEFFTNIEVNTRHSFFFEHPNEHVPGMLIIEGVRQFLLACSHKYGNIPLSGVTIILQDLSAQFTEYMELHSPILIRSIGNEVKYNRHGYWSLYDTDVEVYQKNRLKGIIKVRAISVKNKLFKRFRQGTSSFNEQSRFIPRNTFSAPLILVSEGKQVICKVKDISYSGFCLNFSPGEEIDVDSTYQFYSCFENVGLIQGQCLCVRKEYNGEMNEQAGGFLITEFLKENQQNMTEMIKRYCVINKDRDLYEKEKMYKSQKSPDGKKHIKSN